MVLVDEKMKEGFVFIVLDIELGEEGVVFVL